MNTIASVSTPTELKVSINLLTAGLTGVLFILVFRILFRHRKYHKLKNKLAELERMNLFLKKFETTQF